MLNSSSAYSKNQITEVEIDSKGWKKQNQNETAMLSEHLHR